MTKMTFTVAMLSLAASLSAAAAPLASQQEGAAPAPPAGWTVRPDGAGKADQVKFVGMGQGYHVTLGPATILYQAKDDGRGPFHTVATFAQTKAAPHPEGYGLFYGGKSLGTADQQYTYFLVRGDGQYLIKRRTGDKTVELKPWTANAAIKAAGADGKTKNVVEIDAKRDPAKVSFIVNGKEVHSMAVAPGEADGIVGIRANHNLDLHIDGFGVHR